MSKIETAVNYSKESSVGARLDSTIELKKNFDDEGIAEQGSGYDLRVYCDANGDEFYPWMFSKSLPHDATTGFAKKADVDKLIEAYRMGKVQGIVQHPEAKGRLTNPAASQSFNLMGKDSTIPKVAEAGWKCDTPQNVLEMLEVYARALLRDKAFSDYASDMGGNLDKAVAALNSFDSSQRTTHPLDSGGKVTPSNLFRGSKPGELVGPYVSQFLLHTFMYGNLKVEQKYMLEDANAEGISFNYFVDQQNCKLDESMPGSTERWIYNMQTLASVVHRDSLFQFYYNAAMVALQLGVETETKFPNSKGTPWTSGGTPSLLAAVSHVAVGALRTAWNYKYGVSFHVRPEVVAGRLQAGTDAAKIADPSKVPGLKEMVDLFTGHADRQALLDAYEDDAMNTNNLGNGTYLLKTLYNEGSPKHPSYVAGHAAVSGACVTVLKAMLDCHDAQINGFGSVSYARKEWPAGADVLESTDGMDPTPYNQPQGEPRTTIVGELNKLASNVALGRDSAGVHFRCDGDCGNRLGEEFAISYLVDVAKEFYESRTGDFTGFTLEKFDGSMVRITANGLTLIV